jgi:hypothetical protein
MRWFAFASVLMLAGCSVESAQQDEGATSEDSAEVKKKTWCFFNGDWIKPGTSFKNDCNTCVCMKGGAVACTKMACPAKTCEYNGNTYNEGDTFPSTDGCNKCSCGGGLVACTEMACASTCTYNGRVYNEGDYFRAADGCNTCTCGPAGAVACTRMYCPAPTCDPKTEYNRSYVGTPETCMVIRYTCVPGTSSFSNACGCGCEQPADCPEWINCMPPTDCSALRAKCPLSQVAY